MARYIFITGGVVSSLGKGLASAALGALLQSRGYKVRLRKLDPYLNLDPGITSVLPGARPPRPTTSPPGESIRTSSPRSGAAIISAPPSR
jgi:hypothetical protein